MIPKFKHQIRRPQHLVIRHWTVISSIAISFISMICYIVFILPLQKVRTLVPWQEGYLDFHHIHTGSNVATFVILPDGSTMLIDCGDLDLKQFEKKFGKPAPGRDALKAVQPFPNNSKTTGGWVVDYINHFWPYPNITVKKIDTVFVLSFVSKSTSLPLETVEVDKRLEKEKESNNK